MLCKNLILKGNTIRMKLTEGKIQKEEIKGPFGSFNYYKSMIKRLQEEQKPWVVHNFGDRPAWMPLLGMMEELGELSHAFLKKSQKIRKQDYDAKQRDAIGDIVIYMSDFCNSQGYDLEEIIQATWDEVKKRDWKAYPKNGISE